VLDLLLALLRLSFYNFTVDTALDLNNQALSEAILSSDMCVIDNETQFGNAKRDCGANYPQPRITSKYC
jgi:hypothetical protein